MPLLSANAREALRSDLKQSIRLHHGYEQGPIRFAISNEPHSLWLTSHPDALARVQRHGALGALPYDLPAAQVHDQTLIMGPRSPLFHQLGAKEYKPTGVPNLYAAHGLPEMNPEALHGLMADRPGQVVGIEPHEAGGFSVRSLDQSAFKPVSALLRPSGSVHKPLATKPWQSPFGLSPFRGSEDEPLPEPAAKPGRRKGKVDPEQAEPEPTPVAPAAPPKKLTTLKTKIREASKVVVGKLEQQKTALEEHFKALGGLLDSPERQELLPQIASVNEQLGHKPEAATAWLNAMWHNPQGEAEMASKWLHAEDPDASLTPTQEEFNHDLGIQNPTPSDVRRLAARVVQSNLTGGAGLANRRLAVGEYLQRHESLLGTRAAWEAWSHLSNGDTLALARTRDRLLNRLLNTGHREFDFPNFLRFGTGADSQHMATVRSQIGPLQAAINKWHAGTGANEPYRDLAYAFGAAKLGDHATAKQLMDSAGERLLKPQADGKIDPAHEFLFRAYQGRIQKAIAGEPHAGPLPPDLMSKLDNIDAEKRVGVNNRYLIDRLRQNSWILDPEQTTDAYANHRKSDLDTHLNRIVAITDPKAKANEITKLVATQGDAGNKARVLSKVLPLAPQIGQDFALGLIGQVPAMVANSPTAGSESNWETQSSLLERSLFLAAHYDRPDLVKTLFSTFGQFVNRLPDAVKYKAINQISREAIRGLRKVGLNDQISEFLTNMTQAVTAGQPLDKLRATAGSKWPDQLGSLLSLAEGWQFLGKPAQATPILDAARATIIGNQQNGRPAIQDIPMAALVQNYIGAVSQLPAQESLNRLTDLFNNLGKIGNTSSTASHFSRLHQGIIEHTLRSLIGEKRGLDEQGKKWSDEDEYLVRRRIHSDMRNAMQKDANVNAELPQSVTKPANRGIFALPEKGGR